MGLKKAWKWVKKKVNQAADWANEEIIQPVVKTVKNTVKAILKDPLPFIAQIAGSFIGIPPYVTSAAITAMRGGSITDIAKNAAIAYVGSKAFSSTSYGQAFGETGASVNDFTATLAKDFGLSASASTVIGTAAQRGFTSAAMNGFRAALTGQDVSDAITNGFVSGSVSSASNSYFGDINTQKDWGITPETARQVAGLTSSAGTALLTGNDAEKAMANYISFATMQTAKTELAKTAENTWNEVKSWAQKASESQSAFNAKQAEFNTVKTQYDQTRADLDSKIAVYDQTKEEYNKAVADAEAKVNAFNAERDKYLQNTDAPIKEYQTNVAEYNKQKAIYDDPNQSVDARNAAADKMDAYATAINKNVETINSYSSLNDSLIAKSKEIEQLNQNISDGIGKKLQTATEAARASNESFTKVADVAKTKYEELNSVAEATKQNIQQYEKTAEAAKAADEQVQKQVAEVATREALVDSVNNGTIKAVDNPDAPEGAVTLENGMIITADGKFLQNGKELFTNAYGVEQKGLDFKTESGDHFIFDSTGKRLTSETDAQKAFEEQFGIKIDEEDAKKFVGSQYGQEDTAAMKAIADEKIAEQLKQYGLKADQATIDALIEKGGDTLANIEKVVDPYYVAQDEVNQFFQQTLGREATPEEIIQFIGTKDEADTLSARQAEELQKLDFLQSLFGGVSGSPFDTPFKADYSLSPKDTASSLAADPFTGAGIQAPLMKDGAENAGYSPVDYGLIDFSLVSGAPGLKFSTSPNIKKMGGGQGLTTNVTNPVTGETGVVGELGYTPTGASMVLGDPRSFINDPNVTGSPVMAVDPDYMSPEFLGSLRIGTAPPKDPKSQSFGSSGLAGATSSGIESATTGSLPSSLKPTFLTSTGEQSQMQGFLSPLHQAMSQPVSFDQPEYQEQFPQNQEQPDMFEPFYKYGTNQSIDDIMAGGQDQPQMAAGGLAGTRHGRYAGGGMATPLMAAGGKMRVDFRHGDAVTGEGDGQSDDIPAMLADGEFVFPADVVAAIGNGSTKAGSDKLYDMMHGIRAHVRSAKPQDLPPEIKSPLHFLNAKPKKARR